MKFPLQFYSLTLVCFILMIGCADSNKRLPPNIAKYYPVGGGGVMGLGREPYIDLLFNRGPKNQFYSESDKDFYLAYYGDKAALKRFLHSKDEKEIGQLGEVWVSDLIVLLLRYNDATIHDILMEINSTTRNYVYYIMVTMLKSEDLRLYPKTRALYNPKPFSLAERRLIR